jgi:hypothetical protein
MGGARSRGSRSLSASPWMWSQAASTQNCRVSSISNCKLNPLSMQERAINCSCVFNQKLARTSSIGENGGKKGQNAPQRLRLGTGNRALWIGSSARKS